MKPNLIAAAEIDRLDTWAKYTAPMCGSCISSCCTLPVEVKIKDLVRIGVVDEFELAPSFVLAFANTYTMDLIHIPFLDIFQKFLPAFMNLN